MAEKSFHFRFAEIKNEIIQNGTVILPDLVSEEAISLPFILGADEYIVSALAGDRESHNGLLIATDRRFVFTNAVAVQWSREGIPYNRVIDIYCSPYVHHNQLTISIPENNLRFKFSSRLYAQQFCEKVTGYLSQWKTENFHEVAEQDVFKQLEKLGDLWQKGILTNEEFTGQKRRLLEKL